MRLRSILEKYRSAVLLFCAALILWGGAHANAVLAAPSGFESEALALVNGDRAKHGLAPLKYHDGLTALANAYAEDMIDRKFFAHNDPDGNTPFDRMAARNLSYVYAGENLALNDSIAAAQTAFMNSPTHRANVLNPNFTEIGIGVKKTPTGKTVVVQEFIGY